MSNINRNNYPLEFKISAVKMATDSDQATAQIARNLGVNVNTLYSWISNYSNSNKSNQNNITNNESSFEEDQTITENAVEEIIIGPVSDQKAAKNWVDGILRECNYKNVKVRCSEIPFRRT